MINVEDIVMKIQQLLDKPWRYTEWKVGKTREISRKLHVIPLSIYVDKTRLSPDAGHLDPD
jgi:hypothetical protein